MEKPLVTTAWLKSHINDPDLVLLDASTNFEPSKTIVGAIHFDLKNVFSKKEATLPNTFPDTIAFEEAARTIGINNDSKVVVFDDQGVFNSPRVWWMLQTMGLINVAVLDGGLPKWKEANFPLGGSRPSDLIHGNFTAQLNPKAIYYYDDIVSNVETAAFILVDARARDRFLGIAPEPRKHIQSGAIENAINLPYTNVLENGTFKSINKLTLLLEPLVKSSKPIVFSCGSGITACIVLLALRLVSDHTAAIYDGSWTEWAEKQGLFT